MGLAMMGWPPVIIRPPTPVTPAICFDRYVSCLEETWDEYLECLDKGNNPILCEASLTLVSKNCGYSYQLCLDNLSPLPPKQSPFI